jgi:hypothetical protein
VAAGDCLVCGGDAEFAAWSAAERRLVCGRARRSGRSIRRGVRTAWTPTTASRQSFSDPSRTYRVEACTRCRRYVKGLDEERAGRGVLIAYDPIATHPARRRGAQLGFE